MTIQTSTNDCFLLTGPKDLPIDVLSVIEGYVRNFFGCSVCVGHFLKMASTITDADRSPMRAVIWLWQAHNKANARLHGDASEDPLHPKVQFPPVTLCPSCHVGNVMPENKTFEFLVGFYGKSGVIQVEEDSASMDGVLKGDGEVSEMRQPDWWELQQRKDDLEKIRSLRYSKQERLKKKHEEKHNTLKQKSVKIVNELDVIELNWEGPRKNTGYFSNIDMSLCMMFYLLCSMMIIFLYYHFIVRKKYRPCGAFQK